MYNENDWLMWKNMIAIETVFNVLTIIFLLKKVINV